MKIDPQSLARLHLATVPRHREILDLLREDHRTVGGIAVAVSITRQQITSILRVMRLAGLVDYDRLGTSRRYRLTPSGSQALNAIEDYAGVNS